MTSNPERSVDKELKIILNNAMKSDLYQLKMQLHSIVDPWWDIPGTSHKAKVKRRKNVYRVLAHYLSKDFLKDDMHISNMNEAELTLLIEEMKKRQIRKLAEGKTRLVD